MLLEMLNCVRLPQIIYLNDSFCCCRNTYCLVFHSASCVYDIKWSVIFAPVSFLCNSVDRLKRSQPSLYLLSDSSFICLLYYISWLKHCWKESGNIQESRFLFPDFLKKNITKCWYIFIYMKNCFIYRFCYVILCHCW